LASRVDPFPVTTGSSGFAWQRAAFWFGLTLLAIVLFGAAFAFGYNRMNENTVLPGVEVAGIDVAGLDRQAAERRLREVLPNLSTGSLTVEVAGVRQTIAYTEFDRDYDFDYMLGQALGLGRLGGPLDQLSQQIGLLKDGAQIPAVITWDNTELAERVAQIAESAKVQVVDARVVRVNGIYTASEASPGTAVDVESVVAQAISAVDNLAPDDAQVVVQGTTVEPAVSTEAAQAAVSRAESVVSSELTLSASDRTTTIDSATLRGWVHLDATGVGEWQLLIEPEPINQYVTTYALESDVPATNATFKLGGSGIDVVPSALGSAIDVTSSAATIHEALQARADGQPQTSAQLSLVPVEPTLTTQQAQQIAPRVKKLGEWTTFYTPSPVLNGNGVNIQIPTNVLDGQVVEPGAQFDFLDAIGPITSPPYEAGGALVHGQIKEDSIIGGGMCSVSTTLFNAALRFGLPIWARDNHSLYISRYPVGLDATVWMTDKKNRQTMGFVNDTGYPLVIRGINGPGSVSFQIWGVDDGRKVEFSETTVENTVKPDFMYIEYTNDLAPGRRDRVNDAYDAFDATVTRTVRDSSGNVIIQETYRSHYKQLPAYVRQGRTDGDPHAGRIVRVRVGP
jgi:vancomycin resistance protein YoaR